MLYYSFKIFPPSERSFAITLFAFPLTKYNTTFSPGFLGQRFNNLRRAVLLTSLIQFGEDFNVICSIIIGRLHFWRHWFNMAKILSKFGEQQLVMVNYACGLNQSGTGKCFEWIINIITLLNPLPVPIILSNPLPVLVALKILREILSFTRWFMINTRPLVGCLENSDRKVKQLRVYRGLLQVVLLTVRRLSYISEYNKGPGKRGHIVADTFLPTQMFPCLPARATNEQHLLRTKFCARDTNMVLILFRNILCPQQMFPSLRSPRNMMGNNVSATMCPRLPGP